jgi:hypothetical protein
MSVPAEEPRLLTRRRFLRDAAIVTVGGLSLAGLSYELAARRDGSAHRSANASGGISAAALAAPADAEASAQPSPPPGAGRQRYRSRPDLTPPILTVATAAGRTSAGLLFLTPNNGAGADGPMIVDDTGALVWLRPDSGASAADLRVATYRGAPVLTWWEGAVNGGIGSGAHVVVDTMYREIARVKAGNGGTADLHEFQLTPRGTALFFSDASVAPRIVASANPPPWSVMDCAVHEVDLATQRLVFEWHAAAHIDIEESYASPPTASSQVYDYIHANSIDVLPGGDLLVSARNTCAVYRVSRSTGEIVWRLGGKRSDFTMGTGATFGYQHDARLQPDGTYTLFDDGSAPGHSRAIVLRLDETAMTAKLVREYRRPTDILATSQGNMQMLPNGNVFVGWGSQPWLSEFSPDGTLLYDATFPAAVQSYRDFRLPWTASPGEPPTIALDAGAPGSLTVYASWNGATEVASWDVVAGDTVGSLGLVGSAARSGFETAIPVTTNRPLVAARALDAGGRTLGVSVPVSTYPG